MHKCLSSTLHNKYSLVFLKFWAALRGFKTVVVLTYLNFL